MKIHCPIIEKEYDLAFSLGGACSCTQTLRKANLQYLSFPFDWIRGCTILERAKMLVSGMPEFLIKEDLRYVDKNVGGFKDIYRSEKTGITFYHDFPICGKLDEEFPSVAEKYNRRYKRLIELLKVSSRVLVVYLPPPPPYIHTEDPLPNDEMLKKTVDILNDRFPSVEFDLVTFRNIDEDLKNEEKIRLISDHIVEIRAPYHSKEPNAPIGSVDFDILAGIFSNTKVVDYRTDEERARFGKVSIKPENRAKALYKYLHCTSKFDYFCAKLNWRLYRHFKKKLVKRGVVLW